MSLMSENNRDRGTDRFGRIAWYFLGIIFLTLVSISMLLHSGNGKGLCKSITSFDQSAYESYKEDLKQKEMLLANWKIPEVHILPEGQEKELIRYGKELIRHTARYLGPNGSVRQITNGMNCQNCHLEAGTKMWGNNYAGVASTYPKMRARSGKVESISKRVNDCVQRSLNGKPLEDGSKEMKAIVAYIKFIGKNVPKDSIPEGTGIYKLPYLKRPADPIKGEKIYAALCSSCHGKNGEGSLTQDRIEYTYPPLWGENSYNTGAGLYRLSRLAGYVRYNMPFGVDFFNAKLSVTDCWDVAAYINSQPRPGMDISKDWPDISKKPSDHPFGPFSDSFSEIQHKYGPFEAIDKAHKKK
jgi:thiosulfate dehydrogenase